MNFFPAAGSDLNGARNLLATVQVALALVLLICSGLTIRTFRISLQQFDVPDDAGIPLNQWDRHSTAECLAPLR
jgi:hypothetical protein